ncbi:MAG TPA: leucyl/phenylalanyl-tRNA--protein transferase [Methylophilaceae bacterium]|nr:leucyl/phenylalanyl-tRNA--protein transferase [Methylophilaceae bacterium]
MIPWLDRHDSFPPVEHALTEPNGLLAAGGDLSAERLLQAYRYGIFPWFSKGQPILWWSPNPRMVLFPAELKISRSLAKRLRKTDYEVRYDTAFREVVNACATVPRPGQDGTWITSEMLSAYCELHELGHAHSVETWIDGKLAGGIYGVAIGRMFYGESMFHRVTDASKIALTYLMRHLENNDFGMMDCQMKTLHLASLGGREIPRKEFSSRLAELINSPNAAGKWMYVSEMDVYDR